MKKPIIIALVLLIGAAAFVVYDITRNQPVAIPENGGNATTTPQGTTPTYVNASADMVVLNTPAPGATVGNTFTLSGQARGNWYFEASFPVEVLDANGARLVIMPVQADGEWMTTDFVPFSEEVVVEDYEGPATLVLHRDNASGLPEHDASMSIPITIVHVDADTQSDVIIFE